MKNRLWLLSIVRWISWSECHTEICIIIYEEHYLLFIQVTKRRLTARILHSHKYDRTGHNWRLLCKKDVFGLIPFFARKAYFGQQTCFDTLRPCIVPLLFLLVLIIHLKSRVGLGPRILSLWVYDHISFISVHVHAVVPVIHWWTQ